MTMTADDLEFLRETAPRQGLWGRRRIHLSDWCDAHHLHWLGTYLWEQVKNRSSCGYCKKEGILRTLVVNPITLRRTYVRTCRREECRTKLRDWEDFGNARKRRAHFDWERQLSPEMLAKNLSKDLMPAQYSSVSRATLRVFLDSGAEIATVEDYEGGIPALNNSISVLGFADEVYAELRSGQTVLRRIQTEES